MVGYLLVWLDFRLFPGYMLKDHDQEATGNNISPDHSAPRDLAQWSLVSFLIYVIYKPWLGGVFRLYRTRDRGQRKFAVNIPRAEGEGYI